MNLDRDEGSRKTHDLLIAMLPFFSFCGCWRQAFLIVLRVRLPAEDRPFRNDLVRPDSISCNLIFVAAFFFF